MLHKKLLGLPKPMPAKVGHLLVAGCLGFRTFSLFLSGGSLMLFVGFCCSFVKQKDFFGIPDGEDRKGDG